MPIAPGTSLGPNQVLETLGAGGMGEVYRAHDARLNREVAVKVYFLGAHGSMMAVPVPDGRASNAGKPVALFNAGLTSSAAFDQFAPAPDGQRFLIRRPLGGQTMDTAPVTVILNWPQLESVRARR